MESTLIRLLGPELICRVLDLLHPHEYSGFSHTCRSASELVRRYEGNALPPSEILRPRTIESLRQGQHPRRGMDVSPLGVLPPELFFLVLEFMEPYEYSGLSCTCQSMLSIVNQKLDTPESRQLAPLGSNISRTAAFVQYKIELDLLVQRYMDEMNNACVCYGMPDEDDADL